MITVTLCIRPSSFTSITNLERFGSRMTTETISEHTPQHLPSDVCIFTQMLVTYTTWLSPSNRPSAKIITERIRVSERQKETHVNKN